MEIVIAAALAFAFAHLISANRRLRSELRWTREERDWWAEQAALNAEERADYERALGLPLWDEEIRDRDLWARAAQGDRVAEEVLAARQMRALGVRAEPELFVG